MAISKQSDQNFDAIADKFQQNIYGTSKGRLRHELLLYHLDKWVPFTPAMRTLDAGGGTGVMTRSLLQRGCQVTLNDVSAESLAIAQQQLPADSLVTYKHGTIQQLEAGSGYQLVVCHAVLEWLEHPLQALDHLLELLLPGGYLSLSFFNRDAMRFGNILYGNFDYVNAGLQVKKKVRLNPNNPQYPTDVLEHLSARPVTLLHKTGIRCFHDYLKQNEKQEQEYDTLKQLEIDYGSQHPYLWLGKYFQIILQKNGG